MSFDPTLAQARFGLGPSPHVAGPTSVEGMLAGLRGPDLMARVWPAPGIATIEPSQAEFRRVIRASTDARGTPQAEARRAELRALRDDIRKARGDGMRVALARALDTPDPLRERLVDFWADHFTVASRQGRTIHLPSTFVEDAIRPHVAGRFADMLAAAALHPVMIAYLDQNTSVGPTSRAARRGRGLNENLAREVLELHTLGVGGPYDQRDVRQLAELLTGLTLDDDWATVFTRARAEPGPETVLGLTYDGDRIGAIDAVLADLARHPATAAHVSGKMAAHFLGPAPNPGVVAAMTAAWATSDGDLGAVTAALLRHPAAWAATDPATARVRRPWEWLRASLRALGLRGREAMALDRRDVNRVLRQPLEAMGQPWQSPLGPDGWPEEAEHWVTPQALAARIDWAFRMPGRLVDPLPDPRVFVVTALGPDADPAARFAAQAAETAEEGVALILLSPSFQRR
ncbi:MAG: DUF1800 domain-containing protein [Paracoccaceae bacterium]